MKGNEMNAERESEEQKDHSARTKAGEANKSGAVQ